MEEPIIFRPLGKGDKQDYRSLRLEALRQSPESFESTFEEENEKSELFFERILTNQDKNYLGFGAFINQKLVASVALKKEIQLKSRHRANIFQLYVQETSRNKNIGYRMVSQLIDTAFRTFTDLETIRLTLMQKSLAARCLYYKLGFSIYGLDSNFHKNGQEYDQLILMRLERSTFEQMGKEIGIKKVEL